MNRCVVVLACAAIAYAGSAAAQGVTAITGATVIGADGTAIPNAVVLIEGARIARVGPGATTAIPPNATMVDARGKFLMPGLADMHNHLLSGSFRQQQNVRTNLSVLLAFGVTTAFNPSSRTSDLMELKTATLAEAVPFPRVFGTGPIITVKGDSFGAAVGSPTPETVAEARATVKTLKAAGVDAIKVGRDDLSWSSTFRMPLMAVDVLTALVDEAHQQGLKAYAHAPQLAHAKEFLRAGGDGLLHGILDQPVDQELIDLMRRNRAVYVPTLALFEDVGDVAAWATRQSVYDERHFIAPIADGFATPATVRQFESLLNNTAFTRSHLATTRQNLKRLFDSGVPIVMGTDSGFYGVTMGVSSQLELALMVEAGLTPAQALAAATLNAARMIGRETDLGSVEAGKLADLLILDANPLEDIRNVRRIHRVIRGGTVYDPAQILGEIRLTAPRPLPNQ